MSALGVRTSALVNSDGESDCALVEPFYWSACHDQQGVRKQFIASDGGKDEVGFFWACFGESLQGTHRNAKRVYTIIYCLRYRFHIGPCDVQG